jgi:hypothetical protein
MKKIKLEIELEYNEDLFHGDDKSAINWFVGDLKQSSNKDGILLHSNLIGDTIGSVKVLTDRKNILNQIQK